jgi:predicted dehydrogenase
MTLKSGQSFATEEAAAHAISVARGGTASVKEEATRRTSDDQTAAADPGAIWGDAHRAQLQDLIRAIQTDTQPLIDGRAARKPLEIILGVYESSKTGRAVALG